MSKQIGAGLLSCASQIWASADVLRGASISGVDFPKMMMPFFALMLLESRLIRQRNEMIAQFEQSYGRKFDTDPNGPDVRNDLIPALMGANKGFHQEIAESGLGLAHVSQVQGGNFLNKLKLWLDGWDPDTKRLLGVGYSEGQLAFLNMSGIAAALHAKNILWSFARKWGEIDLVPFNNSEVTTIEEHIKRKWADAAALGTASEQYTPSDLIDLAIEINAVSLNRSLPEDGIVRVYDPTCGGGNFVFAAEDAFREKFANLSTVSRGQEFNDALYALAAIEARFRPNAKIEYGNTLTEDQFAGEEFDVIVANPPYGRDWKDEEKMVRADASGRFAANRMPPTSDGQLLFLQHIVAHLSKKGVATVVHSGSTLFSGDAGGGESETRLWLLKNLDIVEAIIQLPKNMFFNTGISTYLWVLNANKPEDRKKKVLVIDAQQCFAKLKKNLNQKNCEIDAPNRARIIDAFLSFKDSDIAKALSVDDLLYNKVEIEITRQDESGLSASEQGPFSKELELVKLGNQAWTRSSVDGVEDWMGPKDVPTMAGGALAPAKEREEAFKAALKEHDGDIYVEWSQSGKKMAALWKEEESLVFSVEPTGQGSIPVEKSLGKGRLRLKAKAAKVKGVEALKMEMSIEPLIEKDTETIPYSSDASKNSQLIQEFLTKWVKEPWKLFGSKVGCEINFNRLFPKKTAIRSSEDILKELAEIDKEFKDLEEEFSASLRGGAR